MAAFLGKTYTLESSENFDEYMQALGVPEEKRKIASGTTSNITLTESGGTYTLNIASNLKSQVLTFKLGEEIDEETIDGRKIKTVFTLDGNRLTQLQKGDKGGVVTRDFSPSQLTQVLKLGDVVCTRVFKA